MKQGIWIRSWPTFALKIVETNYYISNANSIIRSKKSLKYSTWFVSSIWLFQRSSGAADHIKNWLCKLLWSPKSGCAKLPFLLFEAQKVGTQLYTLHIRFRRPCSCLSVLTVVVAVPPCHILSHFQFLQLCQKMTLIKYPGYVSRVKNIHTWSPSSSWGSWGQEKPSYVHYIIIQSEAKVY